MSPHRVAARAAALVAVVVLLVGSTPFAAASSRPAESTPAIHPDDPLPSHPTVTDGDLLVSTFDRLQWRLPDGTVNKSITPTFNGGGGAGFGIDGSIYLTQFQYSQRVDRYTPSGDYVSSTTLKSCQDPASIIANRHGDLLVGSAGNFNCTYSYITKLAPDLTWISDSIPAPTRDPGWEHGPGWIALESDDCTVRYTTGLSTVRRYNVCTSTQQSNFSNSLTQAYGVQILPDGGMIVANWGNIVRLNASGQVIRTYDAPNEQSWIAVALDLSKGTFWAGGVENAGMPPATNILYQFDVATGAVLKSMPTGGTGGIQSLAVYDSRPSLLKCADQQLVDRVFPTNGDGRVTIAYDPAYIVSPAKYPDYVARAQRVAEAIRDRTDYALDQYQALGFPTTSNLRVELTCDAFFTPPIGPIPGYYPPAPAFTVTDSLIKWKADTVHWLFDAIVDGNFAAGWDKADLGWVNLTDHEAFHTVQISELGIPIMGGRLAGGATPKFESSATLAEDLIDDADDTSGLSPQPNTYEYQHYLNMTNELLKDPVSLLGGSDNKSYMLGALMQYIGERAGPVAPSLEQRTATYVNRMVGSETAPIGLITVADGVHPGGEARTRLAQTVRDFLVAAYLLNKPGSAADAWRIQDSIIRNHTRSSGSPQTYPSLATQPVDVGSPNDLSLDGRLRMGAVYQATVPAGTDWLLADVGNVSGQFADTPLQVGIVNVAGDGTARVSPELMRLSTDAETGACIVFRPDTSTAQSPSKVAVAVSAPRYSASFRLSLTAANQLTVTSLGASADGSRIQMDVSTKLDGAFSRCVPSSLITVLVNGSTVPATVERRSDRLVLSASPASNLRSGNVSYEVRIAGTGATTGVQSVFWPAPDPGFAPTPSEPSATGSLGSLAGGQAASVQVPVAAGSRVAAFAVAGTISDLSSVRVTSPSGRVITLATTDADVSVSTTGSSATVSVMTPESGSWQLAATTNAGAPTQTFAYAATEYDPLLRTDGSVVGTTAGQPLDATFALSDDLGAIAGASVTAVVTAPGGATGTWTLHDIATAADGGPLAGWYGASIPGIATPGSYTVVVTATGSDNSGRPFSRQRSFPVTVAPMVDTDGDLVPDALETQWGLNPADPSDGAADQDTDGLSTSAEVARGTDPFTPDTDLAGEGDGSEVAAGRNPLLGSDDTAVGEAVLTTTAIDGRRVTVSVANVVPTVSVHLYRVTGSTVVDLGVKPGSGATLTEGPLPTTPVTYRAVPVAANGATGRPEVSGVITPGDDVTPPRFVAHAELDTGTTNDRFVNLVLTDLSETPTSMRVGLSEAELAAASWTPFAVATNVALPQVEGSYRVYVQVRDAAGNVSTVGSVGVNLVDNTAPISSLNAAPATTFTSSISLPFTATDLGSGVASVELWSRSRPIGGQTWSTWSQVATATASPFSYTFPAASDYEFYSLAVDGHGNREAAPATADAATRYAAIKLAVVDSTGVQQPTSTDGGATWSAGTIPATDPATYNGIAFASGSAAIAVGDGGRAVRSSDAGATWTATTTGTTANLLAVDGVAGAAWSVGANGTILKSTDAGATWVPQTSGTSGALNGVAAVSATVAWTVGANGVILKTTNGGSTWVMQASGVTSAMRGVSAVDANTAWAVGDAGRILFTSNGGTSWVAQASGITSGLTSVAATSASIAWAAGDGGVILRTKNGGGAWSSLRSNVTIALKSIAGPSATNAWVAGADGTVLGTTNSGSGWSVQRTLAGSTLQSIDATSGTTALAAGSLRQIIATTTGSAWVTRTLVRPTSVVAGSGTGATAWLAGDGGGLRATTNKGQTWTFQDPGTAKRLSGIDVVSATTAWMVGPSGFVALTTNGSTWTPKSISSAGQLNTVDALSATNIFVAGDGGNLYVTTNGGGKWTKQTSGTTASIRRVLMASSTTGWFVGAGGVIRRTTNGSTWTAQVSGVTTDLLAGVAIDANRAWVVGDAGAILRTADGGTTWQRQTSGVTAPIVAIVAYDALTAFALTATGTALVTADGGTTWTSTATGATSGAAILLFN